MKPKIQQLSNGLRFLKIPYHDTKAVAVLVMAKVGSRYESAKINGVSHFVEHLLFKGTKKRPNTQILSQELDKIGAAFNAFTSKDYTGYYIKAQANFIDLALDMLADIIFNSKFDAQEIDKERGVIIEEINMYEDTPMSLCGELLEELVFGKQHPLGWFISGPKKVIQNITREEIIKYHNTFYQPQNLIVAVAGKFDHYIDAKIKEHFHQPKNNKKITSFKKYKTSQKSENIFLKFKKTEQVHLALGFPSFHYLHPDKAAENLLAVILGGNMSSRLFINIREKLGLCYFIRASSDAYEDSGIFSIQAGLDKKRIGNAIPAIINELHKIVAEGISEQELKRAKDYLTGRIALDLEDSLAIASWYTRQKLLVNKLLTPEEKLAEYDKIKVSDLQRVAKKIFAKKYLNLVLIGPYHNKNKFKKYVSKSNL